MGSVSVRSFLNLPACMRQEHERKWKLHSRDAMTPIGDESSPHPPYGAKQCPQHVGDTPPNQRMGEYHIVKPPIDHSIEAHAAAGAMEQVMNRIAPHIAPMLRSAEASTHCATSIQLAFHSTRHREPSQDSPRRATRESIPQQTMKLQEVA